MSGSELEGNPLCGNPSEEVGGKLAEEREAEQKLTLQAQLSALVDVHCSQN